MKIILLILCLIVGQVTIGQSIIPAPSNELCPNEEYTFTISSIPGTYNSLSVGGGITQITPASANGGIVTFKGKFADSNAAQIVTVNYTPTSATIATQQTFKYDKVRSLFGGYKEPDNPPTALTVPLCQTTPVQLNITGAQYRNTNTNPWTYFGSITKYKYRIPAGWRLNGTLSTGTNYITATGAVNITPTADTGNGQLIYYNALNECTGAFFEGTDKIISISRAIPTFALSPTNLSIVCGTAPTQTYTVTATGAVVCPLYYEWNLGNNNNWLYNGSPAPAIFTTTTNSVTLTSANGNILPASVRVTPVYNNVQQTGLNSDTAFTPFISNASFSGENVICVSNSFTYNLLDLGANNTVNWSLSNSFYATISNQTQSQVNVNGNSTGTVDIIATITNQCGQIATITKTIQIGPPSTIDSNSVLSGPTSVRNGALARYSINTSLPQGATSFEWILPYPYDTVTNFDYFGENWQKTEGNGSSGSQIIVFTGYSGSSGLVQVMGKNQCGCGGAKWINVTRGVRGGAMPRMSQLNDSSETKVYPNPATDIVNINLKSNYKNNKVSVTIFDILGRQILIRELTDLTEQINITNIPSGNYILKIISNSESETFKISKK